LADKTIIYYTANGKSEQLLKVVQENLLEAACGLPIISVSQKPMNFGKNICVGEVGFSYHNVVRQVLIGAQEAKTPYIALAEDDCFYSKEHFKFTPSKEGRRKSHYDTNSWLFHPDKPGYIRAKNKFEGSIIVSRKHIISIINRQLKYRTMWIPEDRSEDRPNSYKKYGSRIFHTEVPIVAVEHINALHYHGIRVKGDYVFNLPPWGDAESLKRKIGL